MIHNDSTHIKSGLRASVSQGKRYVTSFAVIHRCIAKGKDGPLVWGPGLSGKGRKENAGEDSAVAGSQLAGAV